MSNLYAQVKLTWSEDEDGEGSCVEDQIEEEGDVEMMKYWVSVKWKNGIKSLYPCHVIDCINIYNKKLTENPLSSVTTLNKD